MPFFLHIYNRIPTGFPSKSKQRFKQMFHLFDLRYFKLWEMKMGAERLGELAKDVIALLKNYEIPAEKFVMSILVSREYYESIKENFPDRPPIDQIVSKGEENWAIDISYSVMQQGGSYQKP
jgi:hypothetical protein